MSNLSYFRAIGRTLERLEMAALSYGRQTIPWEENIEGASE